MNSNCDHHVTARIADDADDKSRQTYRNPTQDQAIFNVMREKRDRR
ncbi:hypothetical protein [Arthrobacter sp. PAMC25564]|nr:hypothetical protein [Arthrobacter sp. PAMC25564]